LDLFESSQQGAGLSRVVAAALKRGDDLSLFRKVVLPVGNMVLSLSQEIFYHASVHIVVRAFAQSLTLTLHDIRLAKSLKLTINMANISEAIRCHPHAQERLAYSPE
jgi:hypothetical protein